MPSLVPNHHAFSRRAAIRAGAAGLIGGHVVLADAFAVHAHQSAMPTATDAGVTQDQVTQAVDALDAMIADAQETTGVSVAVVYGDEVLATRGYGVASTGTNDPIDSDTIFQLASLSKPIASTVVASIVGDEAVTWDTKIVDHLSEFAMHDPWVTSEITIRDMFAHRSGLPEHAGDLIEDIGYDRDEVLHRLRHQHPDSSFRSTYAYTNFGLTAGAVTASNATGAAWEDASAERLYGPAGMTRTSSRFDDYLEADNRASGHVLIDDAWTPRYIRDADAQSPAGGVSSTAIDMAQWMRLQLANGMLDGDLVIPSDALAETHRPQIISNHAGDPAVNRASFYGLGWNVSYDDQGAVQLSHSGAFALGSGTAVYLLPAEHLGIVVLTNAAPVGVAESIALGFLDIARTGAVQNDYVSILAPVFADLVAPAYGTAISDAPPPTDPSPPQKPATYTGAFRNDLYGPITFAEESGELVVNIGPAPDTYPLTHWDRDTFTYLPIGENANVPAAITFTIGADGTASHVVIENLDIHEQGMFVRVPASE
ncbi:MAG: serine hydrolase [Chloroflexota bacterium]|nr:serine hydrolase [Chloroflexota bacterium]